MTLIEFCKNCIICHKDHKDHNKKHGNNHSIILDKIYTMMDNEDAKEQICFAIINYCVDITNSQYGILEKVINSKFEITSYPNESSILSQIIKYRESALPHIIKFQETVIINEGDRFIGIPIIIGGNVFMVVGLYNKKEKYNDKDIKNVIEFMSEISYLLYDLDKLN